MKNILLRSSWQSVNIGDIGHTPGILALLERIKPDCHITLWPDDVGNGVEAMLRKRFPKLDIVHGNSDPEALKRAFEGNDMMLHGSGPSVVQARDLQTWKERTGKPYFIYGVTIGSIDNELKDLLNTATAIYCRDTISLELLRNSGVSCPRTGLGPDATFAIDLHDDTAAEGFLKAHNLKPGGFSCFIPRLRYTPYHEITGRIATEEDLRRVAVSNEYREADHAKQLEAMIDVLDNSDQDILICPEMTYQVELGKTMLYERVPDKYRSRVHWRNSYWTPDEAAAVYARSACVVSFEMHSPIIAFANRTPAMYLRQPTDTSKGQMWRDIGLEDWIFEIDECPDGHAIGSRALDIINNQDAAAARLEYSAAFVKKAMESAFE
jgi:polysaccharide pyruvyl transferase WcaK-like protein